MSAIVKWILAVEPATGWSHDDHTRFERWAHAAAAESDVVGAEMESIERDAHAAHTGSAALPRFTALLSLWTLGAAPTSAIAAADEYDVRSVVAIPVGQQALRHDFARTWADGELTPGVKKSTFWQANPAFGPGWRERYARHASIVRDHHSSAWRYRQNLLAAHDDAGQWDAVSELWWPKAADLIEHFYNSDESRLVVRDDTAFVGRAMPIVTTHTILVTPPPEPARND